MKVALDGLGEAAKVFTPLFPQPGVAVPTPADPLEVSVSVASSGARIVVATAGRASGAWVDGDAAVAAALQRLDWRGILAIAPAQLADEIVARCKEDDLAVEEELGLELSGELRVAVVGGVVVMELPLDGGRFKTSTCSEGGRCVGLRIDVEAR